MRTSWQTAWLINLQNENHNDRSIMLSGKLCQSLKINKTGGKLLVMRVLETTDCAGARYSHLGPNLH